MKKILAAVLLIISLAVAPAFAVTLNLTTLPNNTYGGYYVGGVGGNVDGGAAMLFYCDDFTHTTYVPGSITVNVSTLPSLTDARWGNNAAALLRYEQAAWLISQIATNSSQVGAIQFAIWNIFNPSTPDTAASNAWLASAGAINPENYDFSSVRIYTPIGTSTANARNQEFISGGATPVPEPATVLLLGSGLLGLWGVRRKIRR